VREETLSQAVSVRADFRGGEITPRLFRRGARTYTVDAVNARWIDREGARPVHRFSVQAEGDTYFLSFLPGEAAWRLERVVMEG
jgi:hypothetical protein